MRRIQLRRVSAGGGILYYFRVLRGLTRFRWQAKARILKTAGVSSTTQPEESPRLKNRGHDLTAQIRFFDTGPPASLPVLVRAPPASLPAVDRTK